MVISPLFQSNRKNDIKRILTESGIIDYAYLKKVHRILKPKEFISSTLSKDIDNLYFLQKSCLYLNELERIILSVSEELNQTGYCDMETQLNYTLDSQDLDAIFDLLVQKLKEKKIDCIQSDSLILSSKFLSKQI